MQSRVTLYHGDCLEVMGGMEAGSVDAILTDLPYGTTACSWDVVIPFEPMWAGVKHVLKPNGVFVTTASQPFTSMLVMSNFEWFKYEWIWDKRIAGNIYLANFQPLKTHENVLVFGGNKYIPQKQKRDRPRKYKDKYGGGESFGKKGTGNKVYTLTHRNPKSIINIGNTDKSDIIHPTQKPVALYEYLIRTYTDAGDTVLDIAMGSGTTGVACHRTGRHFIGIEKNAEYFALATKRIENAQRQPPLFV